MRRVLTVDDHVDGVRAGDRAVIGRTLTLVESDRAADRAKAAHVLAALLPHTGQALRVGVSGPPGVGKSTFLEAMGTRLLEDGHRVAVLAVDPTSTVTGGSILGDKTRMGALSTDRRAFVRPSPSGGALGGVHTKTRESIRVMEAAGYDVVLVETVGVGQSEIAVAGMVDTFVLLLLAGAGDELQGIKKGILEVADVLAFTKADGDRVDASARAARELAGALHFVTPRSTHWTPPVLTCSAVAGTGLDAVWQAVRDHRAALEAHDELEARRRDQRLAWFDALLTEAVLDRFRADPAVVAVLAEVRDAVHDDALPPAAGVARVLDAWGSDAP